MVRTEEHPVLAQDLRQAAQILLSERADMDVAPDHGDRILHEVLRHLLVDIGHVLQEWLHPAAAVSVAATLSCGNRDSAPWHTAAETASSTGRHAWACGTPGAGTGASRCRWPPTHWRTGRTHCRRSARLSRCSEPWGGVSHPSRHVVDPNARRLDGDGMQGVATPTQRGG